MSCSTYHQHKSYCAGDVRVPSLGMEVLDNSDSSGDTEDAEGLGTKDGGYRMDVDSAPQAFYTEGPERRLQTPTEV